MVSVAVDRVDKDPSAPPLAAPVRRFLLATRPSGPFGKRLADALTARGAEVEALVLNGGDWIDWTPRRGLTPPRGIDTTDWIERAVAAGGFTDVVCLGDVAPSSAAALHGARAAGARTHVLEQGYFRPNWVTLEGEGVNARSSLPREAAAYGGRRPATAPAVANIAPIGRPHVFDSLRHYAALAALRAVFPHYRYPHRLGVGEQGWGHVKRWLKGLITRPAARRAAAALLAGPTPYFLLFLQREGDSQLTEHSELKTNQAVLETVIASFAGHAPAEARLVVKNHPFDPAVIDYAALTRRIASSAGIGGRAVFIDGGPFVPMAKRAAGVVAVNSTAALTALGLGVPTKLLGRALFDIEGLVDRQPLDTFWIAPTAPDEGLFTRFRAVAMERTQVFGNFHNRAHLARTAAALADRMLAPPPTSLAPSSPRLRVAVSNPDLTPRAQAAGPAGVEVIMPVYGGPAETRMAIRSVLSARVTTPFRLTVVEDASPDPALVADVQRMAERGLCRLLRSPARAGFAGAVNRGIGASPCADVVLLNADVEVFDGWLDRLRAAVLGSPDAGTATPLSEEGSVLTYAPPAGATSLAAAQAAAEVGLPPFAVPTGVGFCLYIRRACLDAVGPLDAAAFPLGYGEEVDFCLRASAAGWRHLAVPSVYVAHAGGVSFGAERPRLQRQGQAVLDARYPGFRAQVAAWVAADPLGPARSALDAALTAEIAGR